MLRSLRHLPHGDLIVVGDPAPPWAAFSTLELPRLPNRYQDSQTSILAGLEVAGRWAYLSNDDFFIMRPVDYVGPSHRGPLIRFTRGGGDYYRGGQAASAWLGRRGIREPMSYETHVPLLVRSDLARECDAVPGWLRTLYGNLWLPRTPMIYDPKVAGNGSNLGAGWVFVSTSDKAFSSGLVGRSIRKAFPDPGPYER